MSRELVFHWLTSHLNFMMAPKGLIETPREAKNFIKENIKLSSSKSSSRKTSVGTRRQSRDIQSASSETNKNSDKRNSLEHTSLDNPSKLSEVKEQVKVTPQRIFVSVSPKIFRKNICQKNKLQREIISNKSFSFKPVSFDPTLERRAPLYLDIPNLYKPRKTSDADIIQTVSNILFTHSYFLFTY